MCAGTRTLEQEVCADGLDQAARPWPLVGTEIVHHHDVAWGELGNEHLIHIGFKGDAVDGAVQHHWRHHAGATQRSDKGGGFPVAMWNERPQALTSPTAPRTTGQVSGHPGFVDEDEPVGIEIELGLKPVPAPLQDVGPILLGGVGSLFCA